jgi:hypothetical protein
MSIIAAGTSSGQALVNTGNTDGTLVLQTNGSTTAVTLGTNQTATFEAAAYGQVTALTGTTPSVDCTVGDAFTLTTSGNTTFTFSSAPTSGLSFAFTLKITAGGTHTLTWPGTVDWAGGAAPDAPASGEVDMYVFMTTDGGTNWYGFLAGDALA